MASNGFTVIMTARQMEKAEALAKRILEDGGEAIGEEVDITSEESVSSIIT